MKCIFKNGIIYYEILINIYAYIEELTFNVY
jgi:hypothetical protein